MALIKSGDLQIPINKKDDLLIELDNGGTLRFNITKNNLEFLAVNGQTIEIISVQDMPGVRLNPLVRKARKQKTKPEIEAEEQVQV